MAVAIFFEMSRAFGLLAAYIIIVASYRLYFSPLARVPGPKIAAVTSLYHFYWDVIKGGQYIWRIQEMHKRYGPIVRIRPDVLHINDPEYIDPIFGTPGKRRDKYKIAINSFAAPSAALGTTHHELHRSRRSALNPFFSKQTIRRLEPVLHRCLVKVLGRLKQNSESGDPMKMHLLYSATTSDIISEYCFGESYNNLDKQDLNEPFFSAFHEAGRGTHFASFNPWLVPTMTALPQQIVILFMPEVDVFLNLIKVINQRINLVRKEIKDHVAMNNLGTTIFHGLLSNPDLPEAEKTDQRMLEEARVLLGAGTDTTASTLAAITYHLLANPSILKELKNELAEAIPDPDSVPVSTPIEGLPYLSAVVKEGLRLHPSASLRQERVAPDEYFFYEDAKSGRKYVIPKGTPVGMTASILGSNEDIYPSPSVFDPNRFLNNPRLDKYQITFSRGSRRCLGINLAYSELYMILAGIFRRYDLYDGTGKQTGPTLELYETTREDVDIDADFVSAFLKKESLGVRVKVR